MRTTLAHITMMHVNVTTVNVPKHMPTIYLGSFIEPSTRARARAVDAVDAATTTFHGYDGWMDGLSETHASLSLPLSLSLSLSLACYYAAS